MASSDLTLAQLLSGQNQMQDPAVAAMAPRMQMAQAMLQEGTSAAPTSGRYGGLARLAQALVGAYGMNQATSGLQDIAQQRRSDALGLAQANAPYFSQQGAPAAPMQQSPGAGPATPLPLPTPQPAQASAGPGNVPPELMPHFQAASTATGIPVPVLLAQARQESNFNPNAIGKNGEVGITQIKPSTAALPGFGLDGVNPGNLKDPATNIMFGAKYLAARGKDAGVTDWNNPDHVALGLKSYNGGGDPNYVQHVTRYLPSAGGGQSVQVAGPGAPTGSPAPSVHDAHSTYNAVTQKWEGEPTSTAAAPTGGVTPAVSPAAPQQLNPAPAASDQAAHDDRVTRAQDMYRRGQAILSSPQYQYNPQALKQGEMLMDGAKFLLSLPHTYSVGPGGIQSDSVTHEQKSAAAPLSNYGQTAPGVYEDATHVGKPVFAPIGRVTTDSAGNVISVDNNGAHVVAPADTAGARQLAQAKSGGTASGAGDWHAGNQNGVPGQMNSVTGEFKPTVTAAPRLMTTPAGTVVASMPGTGEVKEVVPADNSGIAGRAAAASQGEQAGKTAVTVPQLAKVLHEAYQTNGTIDSAQAQLKSAAEKGVPTGYFGPAWAGGLSALKSAGVDISKLGVDPSAVGDIQAGRKSLALVAGGIMRQILGPDSQITEGKLDQFIHATPGLETDPGALSKILDWAKSQSVYNQNMAMHGLKSAANGVIPMGWQSQYLAEHGGGPIYDPVTGGMQQPGEQPKAAAAPPAPPAAPQHSRADLEAEARKRGIKF